MKRRLRRMVSLVCALALCLGLLPAGALPAKAAPSAQTVEGVSQWAPPSTYLTTG